MYKDYWTVKSKRQRSWKFTNTTLYGYTITNKKATLALEKLLKYIETNEGMEDLYFI